VPATNLSQERKASRRKPEAVARTDRHLEGLRRHLEELGLRAEARAVETAREFLARAWQ
jgi:hypothetical protein